MNNALKQQKKSSRDALANSVVNKAIEIEVCYNSTFVKLIIFSLL